MVGSEKSLGLKMFGCSDLLAAGGLLAAVGGLLGEEDGLDVGEDAALGDGDAGQQLIQLLVIPGTKV